MLISSGVAWRTSKPASESRLTARLTRSDSETKLPTVVASASAPGSNIETPPTERGDASAKIRSGNPVLRSRADFRVVVRERLGFGFSAMYASCWGFDQAAVGVGSRCIHASIRPMFCEK